MALKNFMARGETPEEQSAGIAPEAPVRAHRTVAASTCIDASSEVSGKLRSQESIRIDGSVKGEVDCGQTVVIGESANVEAAIQADSVVISGKVKGDITASRKITLQKNARVTGDLSTPGIVIEEGAKLEGRIVIGSDEKPEASKQPQRPAPKPGEPASAAAPGAPATASGSSAKASGPRATPPAP